MTFLVPSLPEWNSGPLVPTSWSDFKPRQQSIADYPSASERKFVLMRSQLNLTLLSNLAEVARTIFPHAVQQNRRIHWESMTIYLDHEIDPSFPGDIVNPGYWTRGPVCAWCAPPETGTTLTSLYARVRNVPEFIAENALRDHFELSALEPILPENQLRDWIWETRPLIDPLHNPRYRFPRYSARPYCGVTDLPILWAVQDPSFSGISIRYFSLFQRKNGQAVHWVEAIPPGELPLFGAIKITPDNMPKIRIVPSEFDPRIGELSKSETFCAVPGGAASLPRTDLKVLAGHKVHLELLPHELAHTPGIIDALSQSKAVSVTFSLVGHPKSFPLKELREVASRHGHNFPLPALPEPVMPDNALIAAGSPVPPSDNPRRFLLAPVIPEGGLVWLYAREKVGKTWLALAIADAVSRGGAIGPWKAKKAAKVVYLDGEMHPDDLGIAIAKVTRGQGNGVSISFDAICAKKTKRGVINLAAPVWREEIERRVKGKSLLILDNFYSLTNNNVGEFPEILDFLQKLQAQGIAIVVIDHTNRDGILQGAHTKERAAETVIEMRIPEGRSRRENVRAIEVTKARHYIPETADYFLCEMVFAEDSFRFEVEMPESSVEPESIPDEITLIAFVEIMGSDDGLSYPRICERFDIARSTASDWHKKAKNLTGSAREVLDQELERLRAKRKLSEADFRAEVDPALKRYYDRKPKKKQKD